MEQVDVGAGMGRGMPALLASSPDVLAATWSGDAALDAALACDHVRDAAVVLFGIKRTTRPVVRALARSLLGATDRTPGRNACLLPVSLALGVDCSDAPLAPDDLAAILEAGLTTGRRLRADPVRSFARQSLAELCAGWPRRRRRDLAIAVLTDESGLAEAFLRDLDRAADLAYLGAFPHDERDLTGLAAHLRAVLAVYEVPSRRMPLAGAARFRGRDVVDLPGRLQVRIPWNRERLEAEADAFANCLGTRYSRVHRMGVVYATVWHDGVPLAAAEVSADGALGEVLGVEDAPLGRADREVVLGALIDAGVVAPTPRTRRGSSRERLTGRVACHAAVVATDRIEGALDPFERAWSGEEPGDRTLALLDAHEALLTDEERRLIRAGGDPDPVGRTCRLGAMLAACGVDDPHIVALDGSALFRRTAVSLGWQVLCGLRTLDTPLPPRSLRLALLDERLPAWQRQAYVDALTQHEAAAGAA